MERDHTMFERINELLRLRPGEARLVLTLGLLLFANSLALEVAEVVAVSGFLSEVGASSILVVWMLDMALIILMTGIQSLIVDRFDRVRLIRGMVFIFAIIYVLLRLLFTFAVPGWLNYTLMYVLADQQWLFFPLVFWILANDVFDMAQAKRLFPLMASLGFIGQIVGLGLAAAVPGLLSQRGVSSVELLSLNALIYLLTFALIWYGLQDITIRHTTHKAEPMRETLTEGWGFIREVPSFRYLTVMLMLAGMALTILEYHFLRISDARITDPDRFQTFYGLYRLGIVVLAIVAQSLLTSRLIEKINLKNTFLILPSALLASAAWAIALPGIFHAAGARALSRLTFMTVDDSARKAFQALVPEERRGRVSIFMESYLPALGTILGSLVLGILALTGLQTGDYYSIIYLAVAALAAAAGVWAATKMRRVYDASLLNWRLKRRQRRADVLDKLEF
jgi:ATP/ADP translocase